MRATQSSSPASDCYSSPDGWRRRAAIIKALHDFPEARESAVTALRTLNALKDSHAPAFEKRFEEYDEDKRGGAALSALADKSKGLSTALHYDIHLSRTYRRSLQERYRLLGAGLQNKPTEPAKSQLNGKKEVVGPNGPTIKKEALNGDQKQENPTHEHIFVPEPAALAIKNARRGQNP